MSKKYKIAVTGGMGGGKTLFCNFISEKGFKVISADELSKEILITDKAVKNKIINAFGEESYYEGNLNREFLAEKVFSSPSNVKKINAIVHPAVIEGVDKLMKEELKSKCAVFVEAALIYEANMQDLFDYVVLVTADEEIRKSRLQQRGIDADEYERRKLNQIPDEKKSKKADFVFYNNGTEEELKSKANFLLKILGP